MFHLTNYEAKNKSSFIFHHLGYCVRHLRPTWFEILVNKLKKGKDVERFTGQSLII